MEGGGGSGNKIIGGLVGFFGVGGVGYLYVDLVGVLLIGMNFLFFYLNVDLWYFV